MNTQLMCAACVLLCLSTSVEAARPDGSKGKPQQNDDGETPSSTIFVAFDADKSVVAPGEQALLSWASSGARSCNASGAWDGKKPLDGVFRTAPVMQDSQFILTCKNKGLSEQKRITVAVAQTEPEPVPEPEPTPEPAPEPAPEPTMQFSVDQSAVEVGSEVTLSWQADHVDSCNASGAWSGARNPSGSELVAIDAYSTFTLTCAAATTSLTQMVSVSVPNIQISWQAPTENVDGTPLDDLQGFKVYLVEQGLYSLERDINEPNVLGTTLTKASGSYAFVVTAYDADGNESSHSNTVTKIAP